MMDLTIGFRRHPALIYIQASEEANELFEFQPPELELDTLLSKHITKHDEFKREDFTTVMSIDGIEVTFKTVYADECTWVYTEYDIDDEEVTQ